MAASVTGTPVTAGEWDIAPDVVGPFGTNGVANETVNTTLTATTQAFDPAVSSDTGDLWQAALGATDHGEPGRSSSPGRAPSSR